MKHKVEIDSAVFSSSPDMKEKKYKVKDVNSPNCVLKVKSYNDLLATIFFYQHHPLVNEDIMDYAIPIVLLKRRETSFTVVNPIKVNLVEYGPNDNR